MEAVAWEASTRFRPHPASPITLRIGVSTPSATGPAKPWTVRQPPALTTPKRSGMAARWRISTSGAKRTSTGLCYAMTTPRVAAWASAAQVWAGGCTPRRTPTGIQRLWRILPARCRNALPMTHTATTRRSLPRAPRRRIPTLGNTSTKDDARTWPPTTKYFASEITRPRWGDGRRRSRMAQDTVMVLTYLNIYVPVQ